ncbi:methyltransferase domain-containing protein [bacterium CPR1]|nr:methyltransferase domain-containing protein [bacterium CPR1]
MDHQTIEQLERKVQAAYSAIAQEPQARHSFPVGRALAEGVGYPADQLDSLPSSTVESFCGVSNLAALFELEPGERFLDLGCGAGLDLLLAGRSGAHGVGVDFSDAMLEKARLAVDLTGLSETVRLLKADAWNLPFPEASFNVALINGLFNLNPQRSAIFHELSRVLQPGGRLYAAEIVLEEPLHQSDREDQSNWFR